MNDERTLRLLNLLTAAAELAVAKHDHPSLPITDGLSALRLAVQLSKEHIASIKEADNAVR